MKKMGSVCVCVHVCTQACVYECKKKEKKEWQASQEEVTGSEIENIMSSHNLKTFNVSRP